MRALEDQLGDGGAGMLAAGIDLEDLHGEDVALAGHDVVEGNVLPVTGIGEGHVGERFSIIKDADFFDAAVLLEDGIGLDDAVGDIEAVEGGVVEFLRELFREMEGELCADDGIGPCGVGVVVVEGVDGDRRLARQDGEGLPREGAPERAAAHELLEDRGADLGLDELRIGGREPRERNPENHQKPAHAW